MPFTPSTHDHLKRSDIDQPNGVAGLDVNGDLVGKIITRSATLADLEQEVLAVGELAGVTDGGLRTVDGVAPGGNLRMGDGVTPGGKAVGPLRWVVYGAWYVSYVGTSSYVLIDNDTNDLFHSGYPTAPFETGLARLTFSFTLNDNDTGGAIDYDMRLPSMTARHITRTIDTPAGRTVDDIFEGTVGFAEGSLTSPGPYLRGSLSGIVQLQEGALGIELKRRVNSNPAPNAEGDVTVVVEMLQ